MYRRIMLAVVLTFLFLVLTNGEGEAEGPIAFWKLDDGRGDIAFDSSGNDNHGFIHGARWAEGKRGKALYLDGKDDYVEIPRSKTLNSITKEITLMAWVKTPISRRHSILERWLYGGEEGVDERSFELDITKRGVVGFGLSADGGGGAWVSSVSKVNANEWTHIAVTSDGSLMRIYINGKQDASTGSAPEKIHASIANLHIGRWYADGTWGTSFEGVIDEVRIYNRALSAEEIAKIYKEESGVTEKVRKEKEVILKRTFYVSLKGSDVDEGTSPEKAFRTISKAAATANAGDTVIIEPGDYGNESVVVSNGGLPNAPITIKAREPGTALLKGTGSGAGLVISNKSYVVIEGIKFANYGAGLSIRYNCSHITIRRCVFIENNNVGLSVRGNKGNPKRCHDILIVENEFYDYTDKQDYGLYLYFCSGVKALNNYFYGWHHQTLSCKKLVFDSLFANNIFEGYRYTALYLGQNLDTDDEGILRSHNLIAEHNLFRPARNFRAKRSIAISNVTNAVVRYNFLEGTDKIGRDWGEGIGIFVNAIDARIYGNVIVGISGTTANPAIRIYSDGEGYGHAREKCTNVKVFNNTIVKCACNLGYDKSPGEVYYKNNIFYMPTQGMFREDGRYLVNSKFEHNNFFHDWKGKGTTDISADPLFTGKFTPLELKGENPHFVPDFQRAEAYRLQPQSPCIDRGTHLTYTVGKGKGTQIRVKDASYFVDGFGVTDGDMIQVGSNKPVRVTAVDYEKNVISVERAISWEDGEGVSFPYHGKAPDIGAYEFTSVGAIKGAVIDAVSGQPLAQVVITQSDAPAPVTNPYRREVS